jgi:hypothetical protein
VKKWEMILNNVSSVQGNHVQGNTRQQIMLAPSKATRPIRDADGTIQEQALGYPETMFVRLSLQDEMDRVFPSDGISKGFHLSGFSMP